MSNDGIKISVNIEHDHAEISARRFSASSVVVNDTIQLEYMWMTLINGDTLTFADGSRYVFYNIYNHRDIDEITLDGAIVRYVRRNMLDEENKPFGVEAKVNPASAIILYCASNSSSVHASVLKTLPNSSVYVLYSGIPTHIPTVNFSFPAVSR